MNVTYHKLSYIDTAMSEANIRAILKGINNSQLSIDGTTHVPNRLALNDVLDFVSMNSLRHAKTSMKSIVERFTKPPYGFVGDDVQWLVAKLFKDGDIAFFVNNDVVTLLTKSEDEVYRYLSRKEYLEKLLTEKREKANDKQKKVVREVMKELFNVTPASDEDDAILKSFQQYATHLKNDLEKFEIHYKNESSYPGENVVKDGKSLLLSLLTIQYSTEFFKSVNEKQEELLEFAEDYEPIKSFFIGDQIEIWNRSLRLLKIYDDSKTFIVNNEIEKVVEEIRSIMKSRAPYREIRKIPDLLDRYKELYGNLLTEMEVPVFIAIEEARIRVAEELEGKECKEKLSRRVIEGFSDLRDKAESCNNVATLQNIKIEADALKVRLLNEISEAEARIIAARQPEKIIDPTGGTVVDPPGTYNSPETKTVSIKSINTEATWRIKTEADVDRYVDALKSKLKQSIQEGIILNIEF